ncbi:MAG: hypothetical protein KC468_26265 [Myxococcales bacterium]|nr:hypothetical protein [Myxococcales bacterium]
MKTKMSEVFVTHVNRWLAARERRYPDHRVDHDEFLDLLYKRLSPDIPRRLGAALHRGYLAEDPIPGRGYFIGATPQNTHPMLRQSNGKAAPCWEMFVHMAEYGSLRTLAEHVDGLAVCIEDNRMDLTVRQRGVLLAYVEVKEDAKVAERLVRAMLAPSDAFNCSASTRADADKKTTYIFDAAARAGGSCDLAFAVRASGGKSNPIFDERYVVRVDESSRTLNFTRLELPIPIYLELQFAQSELDRARTRVAWTIERARADVWLSRGEKRGIYNLYRSTSTGEHILVGMQSDGRVYTEPAALEGLNRSRFDAKLAEVGVQLGAGEKWTYWKTVDGAGFVLRESQSEQIAQMLLAGLGS